MKLVLVAFSVLVCVVLCSQPATQLPFGTQLFLDGSLLQNYKGVYFEQHQPQKMGRVIQPEYPWEEIVFFYASAIQAGPTDYRIYYNCWGKLNDANNGVNATVSLCMANSIDGINFVKPSLGLFDYGGSKANNIVWSSPSGGWGNTVMLDRKPGVPDSERFKMTYDLADRYLKIAASPDGINWSWLASPGIANQFADTQTVMLYDQNNDEYVVYGREDNNLDRRDTCPGNYNSYRNIVRTVSSTNMTGFGPEKLVFSWDSLDPVCLDPYNSAAILYPLDPLLPSYIPKNGDQIIQQEVPSAFLLFPSPTLHLTNNTTPFVNPYTYLYGHNDNLLDIRFIYSYDGVNFSYVTKEPFIPRGIGLRNKTNGYFNTPYSDWDAGMVFMTRGIFSFPSNPNYVQLYYYGTQATHTSVGKPGLTMGIGRAQLRRDGFVSLTTEYNLPMPQGALLTKPILLPSTKLCGNKNNTIELQLNLETSVAGELTVEIQDTNGNPISGFSATECVPIVGNFVRVPVMWFINGQYVTDLTKFAASQIPIQLSFTMSHTKLYSFELVCTQN